MVGTAAFGGTAANAAVDTTIQVAKVTTTVAGNIVKVVSDYTAVGAAAGDVAVNTTALGAPAVDVVGANTGMSLDHLYGSLQQPSVIKNFETTGYNSDGTFGGGVVTNPELKVWQPGEQIVLDPSKNYIYSINADGNLVTGFETNLGGGPNIYNPTKIVDYNLGHPTLNDGGPARISGELLPNANGEWSINGNSGRYTTPYTDRTNVQLQNAADLLQSQGLPVNVVPLKTVSPDLIIK
jgi:hypothetical protein